MIKYCLFIFIAIFSVYAQVNTEDLRLTTGQDTDISQHPWQVAITFFDSFVCGGTLISDNWVLTSAHCLSHSDDAAPLPSIETYIRVGATKWYEGEQYSTNSAIIHPNWNNHLDKYHYDDIALINISMPVKNDNARPIELPDEDFILNIGDEVTATGWGKTSYYSNYSDVLQEYSFKTISNDVCVSGYGDPNVVTDSMFCGGVDACVGDYGGPAVIDGKVVGIIVFGTDCFWPQRPGVFTMVSKYREWIRYYTSL